MTAEKDFKIIEPIEITDNIESSSNLAIIESAYNTGTPYDTGDRVYVAGSPGLIYESLEDSNTGNTPASNPTKWLYVSVVNTHKYRDGKTGTQSEREDNITIAVLPYSGVILLPRTLDDFPDVTSVSLFNIVADTLNINVLADVRESKLLNSYFSVNIHGWNDGSVGTGYPEWESTNAGQVLLEYIDASNYAKINQTITGTSGKKRVVYFFNVSNTSAIVNVNSVTLITTPALQGYYSVSFISDGSDTIKVWPASADIRTDSIEIKEVSEDNLLLNGGFETDINSWTDSSTGTGTMAWDASVNGSLKLTRVDSSNIGKAAQTVTGTAGLNQKYVFKNDVSSGGGLRAYVNGVLVATVAADTETSVIVVSDGSDIVRLEPDGNYTVYCDYAIQTLYTQYDEDIDVSDLSTVVRTDIPSFTYSQITITLDKLFATVKLGELVIGDTTTIGTTDEGGTLGIEDYSKKEVDDFGVASLEQGNFSKVIDFPLSILPADTNDVYSFLSSIRATPNVFIGNEDKPELIVYGFYRDFSIVWETPVLHRCSLEVEELS